MKKDDCFLMRGASITEPMTVYCITGMKKDKIWARTLSVSDNSVDGWPTSREYDGPIPEDAILLPPDSWQWGKNQMLSFIDEIYGYLRKKTSKRKSKVFVGGRYIGHSGICTIKNMDEEKIKYRLFRLDEDNISPKWTGEYPLKNFEGRYAVSEEVYNEVMRRYNNLLTRLRERFFSS